MRAAVFRLFVLLVVSFELLACNSTTVTIVGGGFFLGFSTPIIFTTQDGTPAALVVTVDSLSVAQTLRHARQLRHRFPAHGPLNRRRD